MYCQLAVVSRLSCTEHLILSLVFACERGRRGVGLSYRCFLFLVFFWPLSKNKQANTYSRYYTISTRILMILSKWGLVFSRWPTNLLNSCTCSLRGDLSSNWFLRSFSFFSQKCLNVYQTYNKEHHIHVSHFSESQTGTCILISIMFHLQFGTLSHISCPEMK